jgi:hypothetical protein
MNLHHKKKKDDLIYSLIFSNDSFYVIDIGEYIDDIYLYDEFIRDIREILRKSKVTIVKSSIKVDIQTVIWDLKVRK